MFTFAGKHFTKDWDMKVREVRRTLGPEIEPIYEKIPGRRGVADLGIEEWALEIRVSFHHKSPNMTGLRNHLRQVWAWLRNRGELGELIFDNEPDKVYLARVVGLTELDEFISFSQGELTFLVPDPDALGKEDEQRIAGLGIGRVDSTAEDFMQGQLSNLAIETIGGQTDLILEKYGDPWEKRIQTEWEQGTMDGMMKAPNGRLTLQRGSGAHRTINTSAGWNDASESQNVVGQNDRLVLSNIPTYIIRDDMSAWRSQRWTDEYYLPTRKGSVTQQPGFMRLTKTDTGFDSTVMVMRNSAYTVNDRSNLFYIRTNTSDCRWQFVDNGVRLEIYLPNTNNQWKWFRIDYAPNSATLYELGNPNPIDEVQGLSTPAQDRYGFILGDVALGQVDVSAVYYAATSELPPVTVTDFSGYARYQIPLDEVGEPGESQIIYNWENRSAISDADAEANKVVVRSRLIRNDSSSTEWQTIESGDPIPDLMAGAPYGEGDILEIEIGLITTDLGYSPEVGNLSINIDSAYVPMGSWKISYDDFQYVTRAVRSRINFQATIPTNTSLDVLATWTIDGIQYGPFSCTSGHAIPYITNRVDISNAELEIEIRATTNDPNESPEVSLLQLEMEPGYKVNTDGERISPGVDISSIEDYGSSRIWWEAVTPDPAKTSIRVYVGFSAEGPWTEVNNGDPIPGIGEEGNEALFTRVVLLTTDPTLTPRLQVIGWEISQETDTDLINEGTAPADAIFYGTFQNSADYFQILHIQSGRRIMLEYPFESGDEIEIDCELGRVTINGSARDGQTSMTYSSRWIELQPGYNSFEVLPAGVGEFFCRWRERWL